MNPELENLFTANRPVPPEFFVGREAEIRDVLDRLSAVRNRGGSFISGVHGIGKTSLLNYLKSSQALRERPNLASDRARFIFLPGEIITGFVEHDLWSFVLEDLHVWFEELKSLGENAPSMLPRLQQQEAKLGKLAKLDTPRAHSRIIDFFINLGQAGLVCVVLLDNLGVLFGRVDPDDPVFFGRLRALLQRPDQQGFSLVTASQKSPDELFREAKWRGSRFDAGMSRITLEGLSEADVDKLIDITTWHLPVGYRFNSEERRSIQAIREETNGHPGEIQQAAHLLLEKKFGAQDKGTGRQEHLDDKCFKDSEKLFLSDKLMERDPTKSVVAPPTIPKGSSLPEWQVPEWFNPLRPYCEALLDEHPAFLRNVFVMMRIERNNKELDEIYSATQEILSQYGFTALRAVERNYTHQLWDNVRTHMLCCQYGIAVFERIATNEACPNVALAYGFMSALNRPIMLLVEEKLMENLQADIAGAIFHTFSKDNIRHTVQEAVSSWIKERLGPLSPGNDWQHPPDFDVFLAHNSLDKLHVQAIAEELRQRGVKPWLDEEQIPPGQWFQDVIQQAMQEVRSAAIFIGPSGLGKWQAVELRPFISQCVEAGLPVIPVLLPGVESIPEDLRFLRELNLVRFKDIDDPEALNRLVWGVTSRKPPGTL